MKPLLDVFTELTEETRTFKLYLIRHGEACHNIMEKIATTKALAESIEQGLDAAETEKRTEEARMSVLNDPSLFDAPLSDQGKDEALRAHAHILELQKTFPRPSLVLVSPLRRTLQTANLAFPKCQNVHVREQLRERQTGYACDSREPTERLIRRETFQHFSMKRLRMGSIAKKLGNMPKTMFGNLFEQDNEKQRDYNDDDDDDDDDDDASDTLATSSEQKYSERTDVMGVEEKKMLRERTKLLFQLLLETPKNHSSIAVVTHKGYLRELERGQFGIEDSPLFGNGEVRVYEVKISTESQKLLKAKRLA